MKSPAGLDPALQREHESEKSAPRKRIPRPIPVEVVSEEEMALAGTRYALMHLDWMASNEPAFLKKLYRERKMMSHLASVVERAFRLMDVLEEQGVDRLGIQEIVTAQILAPPDGPEMGDNPPKPLDEELMEKIYQARLDAVIG